jgi:hypothetical protein
VEEEREERSGRVGEKKGAALFSYLALHHCNAGIGCAKINADHFITRNKSRSSRAVDAI